MTDHVRSRFILGAIVVGSLTALPANADVIFSNLGAGDTFLFLGQTLSVGSPIGADQDQGSSFTPLNDFVLTNIELAVDLVSGPNLLDVWLMRDAGNQPGTIIETFHFVDAMGAFGGIHPVLSANSLVHPILTAGNQYWLIASTPGPDEWAVWHLNSTGDFGPNSFRADLGPWVTSNMGLRSVFRITGTPVAIPEPTLLLLLGVGFATAAFRATRAK